MFVGSCSYIFLSSELANGKDIFLVSSFTVCSVSVFEEDPDLSNEGILFSAMCFSLSLLNGFSEYDYDAFFSLFANYQYRLGFFLLLDWSMEY